MSLRTQEGGKKGRNAPQAESGQGWHGRGMRTDHEGSPGGGTGNVETVFLQDYVSKL